MTTTATAQAPCPHCGAPTEGAFCSHCGAPRAGTSCRSCAAPLSTGARFCSRCGTSIGASAGRPSRDRLPWLIAGAALLALLALILLKVPGQAAGAPPVQSEAGPGDASPPDISNMSPRERFNRLYNRVMQAAEAGDETTVTRFIPMALMAYAQLDTIDADARYHAALLRVHTGDLVAARALGDTILAGAPGHLFGYIVQGTVARFGKDEKALDRAYAGFLQHYASETKAARPEYQEHQRSLDDFRKAALAARKGRTSAP